MVDVLLLAGRRREERWVGLWAWDAGGGGSTKAGVAGRETTGVLEGGVTGGAGDVKMTISQNGKWNSVVTHGLRRVEPGATQGHSQGFAKPDARHRGSF